MHDEIRPHELRLRGIGLIGQILRPDGHLDGTGCGCVHATDPEALTWDGSRQKVKSRKEPYSQRGSAVKSMVSQRCGTSAAQRIGDLAPDGVDLGHVVEPLALGHREVDLDELGAADLGGVAGARS